MSRGFILDERQLQKAMQLISFAGDSRSKSINAMKMAEIGEFERARLELSDAKKSLHTAHNLQTSWMSDEMNGAKVEKSILLIHSQDHFMAADIMLIVAEKYIDLNEKVSRLENVET
jgi:PTS system cellobiose-specific IIA component